MNAIVSYILLSQLIALSLVVSVSRGHVDKHSKITQLQFKAAVYEHVPVVFHGGGLVKPSLEEAKDVIKSNLDIYEEQMIIAAEQVKRLTMFVR